jgi:predicted LPLAT superfamily acyltransferase
VEKEQILQKILDQLDLLVNLSKVAYADKISQVKNKVSEDSVMAAILEMVQVQEDLPTGSLVTVVGERVKQKERTIRARLSDLVSMGVLKVEKIGKNSFYRSTGLI